MSTPTQRIVARFIRQADAVADPHALLPTFKQIVDRFAKHEEGLPLMRRLQQVKAAVDAKQFDLNDGSEQMKATKEMMKVYDQRIYEYLFAPKTSFEILKKFGAEHLHLAILQQYALPPKLRKQVEAGAKYYSRTRVSKTTREEALDVYEKLVATYREQYAILVEALRVGTLHTETTGNTLPAGSFTIVNTGGFDESTVTAMVRIAVKAEQLLRAIGVGKVCYGNILLTQRLAQASTSAFYMIEQDELFVRADKARGDDSITKTFCHELAHRLHHKFLLSKDRDIRAMYERIKRKDTASTADKVRALRDQVKPGDTLVEKGKTYVVDHVTYGRGTRMTLTVEMHHQDDPSKKASISLENYARVKGLVSPSGDFVSAYAKTSYGENFAEMVAFYALGHLPQDQVEMLESLLK